MDASATVQQGVVTQRVPHAPAASTPYWLDSLGLRPFEPPRRLPRDTDVAVVGGGLMGVAAGYWLAVAGRRVVLLEARRLCDGATGRNAGLLLPDSSEIEDPALLRRVLEDESIDASYSTPGHLALACSGDCWRAFRDEVARSRRRGNALEALEPADCERLLGRRLSSRVLGGRLFRRGGVVHSARLVHGLARAAEARGALIAVKTKVESLVDARDGLRIETERGTLHCHRVVIACGAASGRFEPRFASLLRTTRAQMFSTRPMPRLFDLGLGIDFGSVYWRQTATGELVFGGGSTPASDGAGVAETDAALNVDLQRRLEGVLGSIFPGFPELDVELRWTGLMDHTADGRPVVGPLDASARRWLVAGFGGHGMPAGLAVGRRIARAICHESLPELPPSWLPSRFAELAPQTSGD